MIEPAEAKDQADEIAEGGAVSPFNKAVAVAVVLCAVFMALCKVKDDNIVQAMQAAQVDKLDNWNFFQAKSTKRNLYELQIDAARIANAGETVPARKAESEKQIAQWQGQVKRYSSEQKEIEAAAHKAEKDYDTLGFRDDQFDLSDALLGLAVALFALASLTRSRWVFGLAAVIALGGFVMGLAGFLGWPIHPRIIKFLT